MQDMRSLLRKNLGRSLATLQPLDRLTAAWPVACGKAMGSRGAVAGFEEGVIRIEVEDQVWLEQMLSMRTALEHDLARIAAVKVTGIHFLLKR